MNRNMQKGAKRCVADIELDSKTQDVITSYIYVKAGKVAATTKELKLTVLLDYGPNSELLGIELIGPIPSRQRKKS